MDTIIMKNQLCFILVFTVMAVRQVHADDMKTNMWGDATCNAQMSLELKDQNIEIKANQPVDLVIHIKNVSSNETFSVYQSLAIVDNSLVNFSFGVTSPSGKDISPKPAEYYNGGSGGEYQIAQGQTKEFDCNLSYLCKFNEMGTYKIIAKKRLWPDLNKQCEITSNPLYVTVVP
jgi:hypothetical protein